MNISFEQNPQYSNNDPFEHADKSNRKYMKPLRLIIVYINTVKPSIII